MIQPSSKFKIFPKTILASCRHCIGGKSKPLFPVVVLRQVNGEISGKGVEITLDIEYNDGCASQFKSICA